MLTRLSLKDAIERETGFRKIQKSMFNVFMRCSLTQREIKLFLFVLDKTIGWDKGKRVKFIFSNQEASNATGIPVNHIGKTARKLAEKNMISIDGNRVFINKNWSTWNVESEAKLCGEKYLHCAKKEDYINTALDDIE